jgi:hypothetical protein
MSCEGTDYLTCNNHSHNIIHVIDDLEGFVLVRTLCQPSQMYYPRDGATPAATVYSTVCAWTCIAPYSWLTP